MDRSRRTIPTRLGVTALVALAAGYTVHEWTAYAALPAGAVPAPAPVIHAQYVIALLASTLAAVLAWHPAQGRGGHALALFLALFGLSHATMLDASGDPGIVHRGLFAASGGLAVVAFIRFTSLFPRALDRGLLERARRELPIAPIRWSRRLAGAARPGRVTRAWRALQRVAAARPMALWTAGALYAAYIFAFHAAYGSDTALMMFRLGTAPARAGWALHTVLWLTGITLGVSNLRVGYAYVAERERRQILWLALGYIAGILVFMALGALMLVTTAIGTATALRMATRIAFVAWPATMIAVLLCLAISVFRSDALDPGRVIRRTATYGGLVVALALVFAGVEVVLEGIVAAGITLPGWIESWTAAAVAALLVGPIHGRLKRTVVALVEAEGGGDTGAETREADPA